MSMITAEPDFVLLERFKLTRDPEAFGEIVRRYTGAVFATCFRILRDPGTAEDAAQETFFRLMTRPQRVTAHRKPGPILPTAARLVNPVVDSRRAALSVPFPRSELLERPGAPSPPLPLRCLV